MLCWRASGVSRSATSAFTRVLEAPWSLTSASVWPTANISLTTPNGPLGLAATTTSPAVNGARRITFHSSVVKFAFASMRASSSDRAFQPVDPLNVRRRPRCPSRKWDFGRRRVGRRIRRGKRRSERQVLLADRGIVAELPRRALVTDVPLFEHVDAIRQVQRELHVLLGEQDREPAGFETA